jgi:hypothetical protein
LCSQITIRNSTIARNSSLGIVNTQSGIGGGVPFVDIGATILANEASNCFDTIRDSGFNISSDSSCNFNMPGSVNNLNPQLVSELGGIALKDNGGPTKTIALRPTSPAIGAVTDTDLCPPTDQRGRPRSVPCDIGAFERQPDDVVDDVVADINSDGAVDRRDLSFLLQDRGKTVSQSACGALCDLNGDGQITGLDARQLILRELRVK